MRHLVELHGGTVNVDNNASGTGAAFTVVLPARPALERSAPGRAAVPALAGSGRAAVRLDGVSVLVTDDDLNARELLAVVLENAGADVRSAASAEDALMMFDTWSPDVFLSDIEMPGEDGYALLRKVRAQTAARARMIAIALTAHARPEDRLRALDSGFQWHLAKLIDPVELISVIVMLVAQSESADTSV